MIEENVKRKNLTRIVKSHIFLSLLLKGIGILLSFILVPLTLNFLGKEVYGVWVVMLSIMTWITLFDIGVGNGLKNKLTENLAMGDFLNAKRNISTAYIIISTIGLILLILLLLLLQFLNWQKIFNITSISNAELKSLMSIFLSTLLVSFVLNLINPILSAFQLSSFTNIGGILTSLVFILFLWIFPNLAQNNLIGLTSFYCFSLLLSSTIITCSFFLRKKYLAPSIKHFDRKLSKNILSLGGSFFVIQIAVLLIFTVDNFLILQFIGSEAVSIYNIMFKLFSVFTTGFTIVMTPMWTAFTEAYVKKDYDWIKRALKWLNLCVIPLVFLLIIFSFCYQEILNVWLPNKQKIIVSLSLVISLSFFVIISIWNNIYASFLNGVSETKLQINTAVIGALINVPFAIISIQVFNMGLVGIVSAMCISLLPFSIVGPIQSYKIVGKLKNNLH